MLETHLHEFSSFWTLTYSDDHYPPDGSLRPRDTQLWLKRLRKRLGPARPIRFFLVGEYGEDTQRAHYHAALYGVASIEVDEVTASWGKGFCYGGSLTHDSAQYISGYVTKKMTNKDDPRLNGRAPEFARMSLRPGIGALAVPDLAATFNDDIGSAFIARTGDVPSTLRHGSRTLPLGRYLRRKLREEMGFQILGGQPLTAQKQRDELQTLSQTQGGIAKVLEKKMKTDAQKILQVEGRARIYSKRNSI